MIIILKYERHHFKCAASDNNSNHILKISTKLFIFQIHLEYLRVKSSFEAIYGINTLMFNDTTPFPIEIEEIPIVVKSSLTYIIQTLETLFGDKLHIAP